MYLFITEDGNIYHSGNCTESDLIASDNGVVDIVEISNPAKPLRYYDGMWNTIEQL